ncbi:hypothetical protein Hanom_Chr07g00634001 [Helianthus anomalus]
MSTQVHHFHLESYSILHFHPYPLIPIRQPPSLTRLPASLPPLVKKLYPPVEKDNVQVLVNQTYNYLNFHG